jgi:hypothetical protein
MIINGLSVRPRHLAWLLAILVGVLAPAIGCGPEGAGSINMADLKKESPPPAGREDKTAGPAPLIKKEKGAPKASRAPGPLPRGDR